MKKNFHISDILTITDGRLVSFNGVDGVYDILNFMTGDDLFTHQLPRAINICQPVLQKQLPHINFNDWKGDINENNYKDAVNFAGNQYGFYFDVEIYFRNSAGISVMSVISILRMKNSPPSD